jgi:hypothetical protein
VRLGSEKFLVGLAWTWSGACALAAIACLTVRGVPAALLFLVSGAAACPLLWSRVAARGGVVKAKYRWLVGTIALMIGMVVQGPDKGRNRVVDQPGATVTFPGPAASVPQTLKVERRQPLQSPSLAGDAKGGKITSLLAGVKTLPVDDYEMRLTFWNNTTYAHEKQKMADKVASLVELRNDPERGMIVERIRPRKEGFGNVLVLDITLRNDSLSNLKDFHVTCISKGRSGSMVGSNTRVLYVVVKARSTRTFRKLNMGFVSQQAATTACHVDGAVIA